MLTDRRNAPGGDPAPGSTPEGHLGRPGDGSRRDHTPSDRTPSDRTPGGLRRIWFHAAALLLALLAIVMVVDNGASAITDEGAVVAQVDALSQGTWSIDLPLPTVDADGEFVTMENSDVVGDTYRPYAKHPAYPVLLLPFWSLGGHLGLLVAAALGTWAAALVGMFLCRRMLEPAAPGRRVEDLGLATLWVLGLGSPLLFGATTVMAHSIAAALTGGIVLALIAGLADGVSARRRVPLVLAALLLAVPLVLLRSEGLLAIAGITAGLGLCSIRSLRPPRLDPSRLVTAVAIAGIGLAAYRFDGRLAAAIKGDEGISSFVIGSQEVGFVEGRLLALWASVLRPGDPRLGAAAIVLLVATVCMVAGALLLRCSPRRRSLAVQLVVVGAALTVVRQFLPVGQVTGLVAAFPLLVMGLVQLRRADVASLAARVCLIASAVTATLVLATSYSIGGAAEWGGRFYHLLLPLLVPLAVIGAANALTQLRHPTPIRGRDTESETDVEREEGDENGEAARTRAGRGAARVLTAAVLVAAVSMSILCLRTGIAMRQNTEQVVDRMLAVATAAAAPNDGGPPIVVTDPRGLGRVSWDHLDQVRILRMPEPGRLEELLDRLAAAEVGAVVLAVHPDEDLDDQVLGEWRIARDHLRPGQAWRHVELVQRDSLRE
ncbi:MAG: hypothetical protein M3Y51_07915 [Actinomycetota bacterium]|nr:hypothetical protein [Actinomycetota bacterium]